MKKTKILQQKKKQSFTALVLCAVFMLFFVTGKAQSENNIMPLNAEKPSFYKHEIGVSYGALPSEILVPVFNEVYLAALTLNLEYKYNINKRHAVVGSFTYHQTFILENNLYFIAPLIGYEYTYFMNNDFAIYFRIGVGYQWLFADDPSHLFRPYSLAYQISPLCISIGNKHNLDLGFGFGTQGVFRIGYKYKF
jgi:hypothetical protein